MIESENGRFVPACDYCNARLAPEAVKEDAIMAMKIAGWNSPKIGNRILNYCKECSRHLGIERPRGNRPARQQSQQNRRERDVKPGRKRTPFDSKVKA